MNIVLTAHEANDRLDWEKFCEITGLSYYALTSGAGDLEFTLSEEQALACGLTLRVGHEAAPLPPFAELRKALENIEALYEMDIAAERKWDLVIKYLQANKGLFSACGHNVGDILDVVDEGYEGELGSIRSNLSDVRDTVKGAGLRF